MQLGSAAAMDLFAPEKAAHGCHLRVHASSGNACSCASFAESRECRLPCMHAGRQRHWRGTKCPRAGGAATHHCNPCVHASSGNACSCACMQDSSTFVVDPTLQEQAAQADSAAILMCVPH
eukprot:1157305-Pelagomonas_calceolata.AAC.8